MFDEPGSEQATGTETPSDASSPESADSQPTATEDPTVARFTSCRWHAKQDGGAAYCSHRDVLPYAGMNGFKAEAWCPDCTFYKVRRTVKKRPDPLDY
jgi:hypothetical protein